MSKFGSGLYRLEVKAAGRGRAGKGGRPGQGRAEKGREGRAGQTGSVPEGSFADQFLPTCGTLLVTRPETCFGFHCTH